MTNAELIKALRWCGNIENEYCVDDDYRCPYFVWDQSKDDCKKEMMLAAADALEAADKRIAELESNIPIVESVLVDKLNQRIAELEEQLPKEGEWIESNRRPRSAQFCCSVCHRTCYDIQPTRNKAWTKRCRYHYCPNCGAKMKGKETDDGVHVRE